MGEAVAGLRQGQSLKAVALRGSAWIAIGYAVQLSLRLGSALVLTRLLMPEAYGLMNLVAVVVMGLELLSDVGITPAIVRDERGDDRRFLDTLWTVQVIRGALLWLLGCGVAAMLWWVHAHPTWSLPGTWGDPALPPLIAAASGVALIFGLLSTKHHSLRRHLRMGRIVAIETIATAASIAAMIPLAYTFRSVWALVAGTILFPITKVALSWIWLQGVNNRVAWDSDAVRRLYHFAKWIFLSSALLFLATQGDRLMLGYLLDMHTLGVYGVAILLAGAGMSLIDQVLSGVMYPAMGRVWRERPQELREAFYHARRFADIAFVAPSMVMAGAGALVVLVLFDARYAAAGWMFEALAVRAALSAVSRNFENVVLAMGKPHYCFALHVARTSWIIAGIFLGWTYGGLQGVIWAVALSELAALAVLYYALARHRLLRLRGELPTLFAAAAGLFAGWAIEAMLHEPVMHHFGG